MFGQTSRYHGLPTATWTDEQGRTCRWVRLRTTTPPAATIDYTVGSRERFDLLGYRAYGDAKQWWRVPDANKDESTGIAQDLLDIPGETINLALPVRPEVTPQ